MSRKGDCRDLWIHQGLVVVAILAFGFVGIATTVQSKTARDRCEVIGGQTWDGGTHCVLGDPRIVSTR